FFYKMPDTFWCIATTTQSADGGHTRVVPAANNLIAYQLQQTPLTHNGIGDVSTGKLILMRWINFQFFDKPIVKRSVVNNLQRTNGMGYLFDAIALAMGKIIHRVNAPFVASAMMPGMFDAVN